MKFLLQIIQKWIKLTSVCILIFILNTTAKAKSNNQLDTLKLPLPEVEKIFMEKNLSLFVMKHKAN